MYLFPEHEFNEFVTFPVFLVTRICVLISNLLVVVSTWQAAHHNRRVGAWNSRGSLMAVLFRDGACSTSGSNVMIDCVDISACIGTIHFA